ncbi:hypothetical protein FQA39_LY13218 [Lamprigera yunnana]|nr:hypothetical protein FQA39_LY13218 [Lamprigera yunnana]
MIPRSVLTSNLFRSGIIKTASHRTMSTEEDVLFKSTPNAGIVTLNRPKSLNALNLSMVDKIYPKLREWEPEKKLIIIKGVGEKAFCAGGDVRAIAEDGMKGGKLGSEFFRKEYALNGLIGRYKKPYIALIDGIVMGGGVGLSVHGDYRIATERTLFAMPETAIGLFPDVGGTYFLPRLQGKLGLYLALTGYRLKGSDVYKAGIATHYCDSQCLNEVENSLIECSNIDEINKVLEKYNKDDGKTFSLESVMNKINKCFAAPTVELIIKELERDGTEWANGTIAMLKKMSPTSLKVSLKALTQGSSMNLDQCLEIEYRIAVGCLRNKDFFEGVRALLIDKDQKPRWNPSLISEVTEGIVNNFFNKLNEDQELIHKL